MRGFLKALKHEWRWLPTRRESGAYVALLMAIVFSSMSVSRVAITTPEGFNKQLTWNAIDELLVLVLLGASLFAIYTMYRLFQAEASAGRPAVARLQMGVGSLLVLLLTLSVARPLFISEILIYTATPRYENVTPEEVWKGHEESPLSRELYIAVCQAIVDRDYEMGRPLRQCVDPDGSGTLLSLEPSEQAKEFKTVYRNLYHMRHAGIRLLSYWLVGLVIIAIVFARRKKAAPSTTTCSPPSGLH